MLLKLAFVSIFSECGGSYWRDISKSSHTGTTCVLKTLNALDISNTGSGEMLIAWPNTPTHTSREAVRCAPCASSPVSSANLHTKASRYFHPASDFSVGPSPHGRLWHTFTAGGYVFDSFPSRLIGVAVQSITVDRGGE